MDTTSNPGSLVFVVSDMAGILTFLWFGAFPSQNQDSGIDFPTNIKRIYSCRYSSGFSPDSLASGYVGYPDFQIGDKGMFFLRNYKIYRSFKNERFDPLHNLYSRL